MVTFSIMKRHGLLLGFIIFISSCLFSEAGVQPKSKTQTAELGKTGRVIYEVTDTQEPDPDHPCPDFACRTPLGPCNNTDKYQVTSFSNPIDDGFGYSWECGIQIIEVKDNDAGVYMICRVDPSLNRCLNSDMNVTLSVWRTDRHGRICTTSYDKTTGQRVSNCTAITTTPTPTTVAPTTVAPTTEDDVTTPPEKNDLKFTTSGGNQGSNKSFVGGQKGEWNRLLCKRNIVITAVVVAILTLLIVAIILVIRRAHKRHYRRRNDYELGVRIPHKVCLSTPAPGSNGQAIQGDSGDNDSE